MRELCALVLLCVAGSPVAFGGDPFESDLNRPKLFPLEIYSETTLAGVNPEINRLDEVIVKLGKPDRTDIRYSHGKHPTPVGGLYEWQTINWRLRIEAVNFGGPFTITKVDVWGAYAENQIGMTGEGLKLGDTIDDVRRVYRLPPYFDSGAQKGENRHLPVGIFRKRTLQIQFDKNGRIDHLTLTRRMMR